MSDLTPASPPWYVRPVVLYSQCARGNESDTILDGFLAGEPPPEPAAEGGIQKVSYTHEAMVDLVIARPELSQRQIAEHFGYNEAWISQIFTSDAFQAKLAERREALVDPAIRESLRLRFDAMVQRSLEILSQKLSLPAKDVPDQLALRAFELSTRAAGYGARVDPVRVDVNVSNHLELLSGNLTALLRRKKAEALDVTPGLPAGDNTDAEE